MSDDHTWHAYRIADAIDVYCRVCDATPGSIDAQRPCQEVLTNPDDLTVTPDV